MSGTGSKWKQKNCSEQNISKLMLPVSCAVFAHGPIGTAG